MVDQPESGMADWESLSSSPQQNGDVMSLFTTKTASPLYRMNGHVSELQFASPVKAASGDQQGRAFCQADNVEQCVSNINQEVTTLGMSSLYADGSRTFDIVRLVNCTYDLLQKHRQSSRIREELENREHRTKADIDHLKQCQQKLKFSLEQNERDLAQQQEKERQLVNKNKTLAGKLKIEKEEVKRLQSSIGHREAQYRHEVKKRERELIKLKERIHQLLTDRTEKRIGLELSDPLIRSDGKRGTWKTGNKQEEELYRGMISDLEDRQRQLVVENTDLRQCLRFLQRELSATLANTSSPSYPPRLETNDKERTEESDNEDTASDVLSEAHYEMPFDVVRDDIQKSVKETVKQIQKRFAERGEHKESAFSESSDSLSKTESPLGATASVDNSHIVVNHTAAPQPKLPASPHAKLTREETQHEEIEKLKKQIVRYKDIVEQQETLIQSQLEMSNSKAELADTSIMQHSAMWEERQELEVRERLFQEKQANFEEERKHVTEAAIQLARERKEVEEKRAELLTQEFFNLTPFREASKPSEKPSTIQEAAPLAQPSFDHVTPTIQADGGSPEAASEKHSARGGTSPESEAVSGHDAISGKALTPVSGSSDSNDGGDAASNKEQQQKKSRSRRLLPATPSSTPDLNTHKHEPPLVTPRVMARPHSSIAIADGAGASSFVSRVLRPRSSAPSTAELYKKLGLEPPAKDRGRQRDPPRMPKFHTHEAMDRHPRAQEPPHTSPTLAHREHSYERQSVSSSADESPVSPTVKTSFAFSKSQEGDFPAKTPVSKDSSSESPDHVAPARDHVTQAQGHVTHVQTGFKIDIPSDNSSSTEHDYGKRLSKSRDDLRFYENSDMSRKSKVAPKLGQKYGDRKRDYDFHYRRDKSKEDTRSARSYRPDYSQSMSKDEVNYSELNKDRYRSNRSSEDVRLNTSRDDLKKSSRSRDSLVRPHEDHVDRSLEDENRPPRSRASRSRERSDDQDRFGTSRDEISHSDSSRDKFSRSDRSRDDRLDRSRDEFSRSDRSRDDTWEREKRRSGRRSSRERREKDSTDRHTPREYKREKSRDKHRQSSAERRHERDRGKRAEQSASERPRSGKTREEHSSERPAQRHAHRERPKTARDSYFYSGRLADGSMSARDHERRNSGLRREASFEGFSLRDRRRLSSSEGQESDWSGPNRGRSHDQSRESSDRERGRSHDQSRESSNRERGRSHERGSIEYYLRRQSGGAYPVAALILRNPEKMDTYSKSTRKK